VLNCVFLARCASRIFELKNIVSEVKICSAVNFCARPSFVFWSLRSECGWGGVGGNSNPSWETSSNSKSNLGRSRLVAKETMLKRNCRKNSYLWWSLFGIGRWDARSRGKVRLLLSCLFYLSFLGSWLFGLLGCLLFVLLGCMVACCRACIDCLLFVLLVADVCVVWLPVVCRASLPIVCGKPTQQWNHWNVATGTASKLKVASRREWRRSHGA
jgi:hypothetical protein